MQRRWICRRIRSYLASASVPAQLVQQPSADHWIYLLRWECFGDRHASARKVLCTLAWHLLYAGESTQGIPVVSQGRVARAKVAAALAARASDLASRGDEILSYEDDSFCEWLLLCRCFSG